jgi:hypothetical protein
MCDTLVVHGQRIPIHAYLSYQGVMVLDLNPGLAVRVYCRSRARGDSHVNWDTMGEGGGSDHNKKRCHAHMCGFVIEGVYSRM